MLQTLSIAGARSGPSRLAQATLETLFTWHERARQRRQLGALDARMLSDIGVSFAEATQEARKPFWRT